MNWLFALVIISLFIIGYSIILKPANEPDPVSIEIMPCECKPLDELVGRVDILEHTIKMFVISEEIFNE